MQNFLSHIRSEADADPGVVLLCLYLRLGEHYHAAMCLEV